MVTNLKLIFVHGIDDQRTNYSTELFNLVLQAASRQLQATGVNEKVVQETLRRLVHHEVIWANLTTDLTNRYTQLAYSGSTMRWGWFTKSIDPLAIQIMHYIKDKGDKPTGEMNILRQVEGTIDGMFAQEDVGINPPEPTRHHALLIAHSLGSVIAYDYVMGFRQHRLPADVTIHNFITMGSPLPAFTSAMGHPDDDLILPSHVKAWTNIRSRSDGFARPLQPFFRQIPVRDHVVHTGFWPLAAHSGYWRNKATANIIASAALAALKA